MHKGERDDSLLAILNRHNSSIRIKYEFKCLAMAFDISNKKIQARVTIVTSLM